MGKNNVDMLSGGIFKGLLSMTIPIMIMNVLQNMFNLIDMIILGKFTNDVTVGAIGTCATLITLCTGLLIGVSTGANVIVAKAIGSGDNEHTERAVGTSVLFSVVSGIVLLIIGVSCAKKFLMWINCPDSLLDQAVLYFRLYFLGVPLILLYNFTASILRAGGDAKRPMYYLMIGGIVKIVLNYFCIILLDMTVEGAAIATIVSNAVSSGLGFWALLKSERKVKFSFGKCRFYLSELKGILFIGVPAGVQISLYSLANTVITTAVNGFGADAATGISIANQFDGLIYHISTASVFASTPYIAQNIGAGNLKRTKRAIVDSIWITVLLGGGIGVFPAIFCEQLSSFVSTTPAVIEYSCQKMIVASSTYFICGINDVIGGTLRAMGKPIFTAVSALVFMCLIRFAWVYIVFPLYPTLTFLYLIWPIGWVLSIIAQLIVYFPAMTKLQKNQNKECALQTICNVL